MSIEFMKEGLDGYDNVVVQIDDSHRIIRCSDDIQFISQYRVMEKNRYPWRSVSFYQTALGAKRQEDIYLQPALSLFEVVS